MQHTFFAASSASRFFLRISSMLRGLLFGFAPQPFLAFVGTPLGACSGAACTLEGAREGGGGAGINESLGGGGTARSSGGGGGALLGGGGGGVDGRSMGSVGGSGGVNIVPFPAEETVSILESCSMKVQLLLRSDRR